MRLPDTESGKAEEEMLSYRPAVVIVLEFKSDSTAVFVLEVLHRGLCWMKPET